MPHPAPAQAPIHDFAPGDAGWAWDAAMRRGDFAAAWAVSDAVLASRGGQAGDDPMVPYHERWVWDGRAFDGRDVLVRCYHGLGDTLQFCRYLPALRARAGRVVLEAQAGLVPLLRGMADEVVAFDPAVPLPPSGCDLEIMELGHALRMVPGGAPYLPRLGSGGGGVGFCWAAGGWDGDRDMPGSALAPLTGRVRGASLQRGEAAAAADGLGLVDPLGGSMELAALAGLVAGLDAVVTVDTMVAHLAGAMGVPALLLLKHVADWRWGAGGRSVWYGRAELFRQARPGDWASAVRELSFSATFKACCS